jgi:hypothetical protein
MMLEIFDGVNIELLRTGHPGAFLNALRAGLDSGVCREDHKVVRSGRHLAV